MSRQNYYKCHKKQQAKEIDGDLIESIVRAERSVQPRLGSKKLYKITKKELESAGVVIGRDKFIKILKERGLLLDPLPKAPRTTNSRHGLPVYRNLVKDLTISSCNQVWVSDITYIRTDEGFLYLSLTTDYYSRMIVGYHAGDTLEAEGCLKTLHQAALRLSPGECPIHHSDRGSQYCSHAFKEASDFYGLSLSMTEENHCYENSVAERLNGILKQEYWLGRCFKSKEQAIAAINEAVVLYNERRPHNSLGMRIPAEVYRAAA